MTPLEELQAAHKRLSELSNRTGGNDWKHGRCDPGEGWFYVENADTGEDELYTERGMNVDLAVTLHRTIDAQLLSLEDAARVIGDEPNPVAAWALVTNEFRLARAINGEAS